MLSYTPSVPELSLDELRTLVAVADAGSIAAASTRLGVSSQAVSVRVRTIEANVGLTLFERSSRGVSLSEDGVEVTRWAGEVLAAAYRFDVRVHERVGMTCRRLRVAASLTVAEHLVPTWMVEVASSRGDIVDLAVMNSVEVCRRIRSADAELGFVETLEVPDDLDSKLVARDELVLVAPKGHPLARRGLVTLAEAAAVPLVTREAGSGTRSSFEQLCRSHRIEQVTEPSHVLPTSAAVRAAVIAGAGPAVLSTLAVRDDVALGRLEKVRIADVRLVRPLSAVWDAGGPLSAVAENFLEVALRTPLRNGEELDG
jgi:DNA-binding transcriptional LysR family regulator